MNNNITIDDVLTSFSRLVNQVLFNEQFNRTLTQKAEEDWNISKSQFHTLVFGGVVLGSLLLKSRK